MKYLLLAILALPACGAPTFPPLIYLDGTTVGWTATPEQHDATFNIVAALYSPFNVTVTDQFPGSRPDVAWIVIGGPSPSPGIAGQAVVNNWSFGTTYSAFGTAFAGFVYADSLGNDPTLVGVAAAHEAGHLFGLEHTPTGVMMPVLDGTIPNPAWPVGITPDGKVQDSYADLGGTLGFAAVPEPQSLLVLLPLLLMPRHRRQIILAALRRAAATQPAGGGN